MPKYKLPFSVTPQILALVSDISEQISYWSTSLNYNNEVVSSQFRIDNRNRHVQEILGIYRKEEVQPLFDDFLREEMPLKFEKAINLFSAYEILAEWEPDNLTHLFTAHTYLMKGLAEDSGEFRQNEVGILDDGKLIFKPPLPGEVMHLMMGLLEWLKETSVHPLVASCLFHYGFVTIHPFHDGNGRIGRLWQTLILSKWMPVLEFFPIEMLTYHDENEYYSVLNNSQQTNDATGFVEYMLRTIFVRMRQLVNFNHHSTQKVQFEHVGEIVC